MSLANKLAEERRARLAAERLLELKQAELFAANRKLGNHAQQLSNEIVETRAEVAMVRGENRRVKTELGVAHEKILIAERRLWHSIETLQDGFAFFDSDNRMIMANHAYLAVFEDLDEVQPGITYPRLLQLLTEEGIINIGQEHPAEWRARMQNRWQQEDPQPMEVELWNGQHIRIFDRRGPSGDVVSLALNITSSVRYEEQLFTARDRAEAANRAKSAFLANMSHEIRTPMNGVVGMADLLMESGLNADQRTFAQTIKHSGEALLVIINDILDYSKIDADKLVLAPEPFDLEKILLEVVTLLQPSAQAKSLSLRLDYNAGVPTRFIADPGRIRQIVTNLMGNAVKFTLDGHVHVRVDGEPASDTQTHLRILVKDTGIGIAAEKIDHVFGEFNQVEDDRNRQFEGTGLGLTITKGLVDLMGGNIWVTSKAGVGSCFGFEITLPNDVGATQTQCGLIPNARRVLVLGDCKRVATLKSQITAMGGAARAFREPDSLSADLVQNTDLILVTYDSADPRFSPMIDGLKRYAPKTPVLFSATNTDVAKATGLPNVHILDVADIDTTLIGTMNRIAQTETTYLADKSCPKTGTPKILLAEDNKTNQLVFRKMLGTLGVEVLIANDGHEAVAMYESDAPDIVFMDISMPRMDGKEATTRIRQLEGNRPPVPIIAVTAHAMDGDRDAILAAGLTDYLTKPLRKNALLEKLGRYCPQFDLAS